MRLVSHDWRKEEMKCVSFHQGVLTDRVVVCVDEELLLWCRTVKT